MEQIYKRLANLLSIKSLVTLVLTLINNKFVRVNK